MTTDENAEIKAETIESSAEAETAEKGPAEAAKETKEKAEKKTAAKTAAASKTKAGTDEEKPAEKEEEKKPEEEKKENDLLVKFTLEVPREEVEKEFNEALVKYAGEIKLPGFRKGKVPVEMIKSRYKDAVKEEAVNKSVEKALMAKIEKDEIKVISTPQVLKVDYEEGKDLKADIQVEVLPTVPAPDLESITVEIPAAELTVEPYDEEKQIDALLESNRRQAPVLSREIRDDDVVQFQFQSKILQTKRMTPRKAVHFRVNKTEESEILDLYKEIIGKKVDDNLTFKRSYPADYKKKPWAGKEVEHYIKIESVFEWVKPAFDQDFLKKMGFEDEESFKKKLKEDVEQYNKQQMEEKKMNSIVDRLIEVSDFPLPQSLVQEEMSRMLQQNQFPRPVDMNDEKKAKTFADLLKTNAEKSVRFSFIIEAIKEGNNITVTPDEMEQEYRGIAEKNSVPVKEVRKYYMKKENAEHMKDHLLRAKVMDLLKEKVTVKIKEEKK